MEMIPSITPPRVLADADAFRQRRADRAYKDFEAMFLQIMLKEMRRSAPDDGGIFPRSEAMDTFEEMLDAALAQSMADGGQLGIAKQLAEEGARLEAAAAAALDRSLQQAALPTLKPVPTVADNP